MPTLEHDFIPAVETQEGEFLSINHFHIALATFASDVTNCLLTMHQGNIQVVKAVFLEVGKQ